MEYDLQVHVPVISKVNPAMPPATSSLVYVPLDIRHAPRIPRLRLSRSVMSDNPRNNTLLSFAIGFMRRCPAVRV